MKCNMAVTLNYGRAQMLQVPTELQNVVLYCGHSVGVNLSI